MTMLLVLAGMRLGAQRGAALAILATLLTNAVLGHGPWTYLQATGWAFCAVAGGVLNDWLEPEDVPTKMLRMALVGTVIGFLFGPWTILTDLLTATPPRRSHWFRVDGCSTSPMSLRTSSRGCSSSRWSTDGSGVDPRSISRTERRAPHEV